MDIYERAIRSLQIEGLLHKHEDVMVSCAGEADARILQECGLRNVLLTNIDHNGSGEYGDYRWQHCDAEDLPFADGAFEWGFVHAGLHHCSSPHRGLTELLRVSRKGVLVIEARDSMMMRLAVRLGFTSDYELEAVALSNGGGGGLRNGKIPNFIYRWTEREVRKTVEAAYPERVNEFRFFYGLRLPTQRMSMSGGLKRAAVAVGGGAAKLLYRLMPWEGNQFAFAVIKTDKHKPWIRRGPDGAELDPSFKLGFNPAKYDRGYSTGGDSSPRRGDGETGCNPTAHPDSHR